MTNPDSQYELGKIIGELKTEIHALTDKIDELKNEISLNLRDHEVRIRSLEQWRYLIVGAGAASGAIASFIRDFFA